MEQIVAYWAAWTPFPESRQQLEQFREPLSTSDGTCHEGQTNPASSLEESQVFCRAAMLTPSDMDHMAHPGGKPSLF